MKKNNMLSLIKNGFFHILSANFISKIVLFVTSFVLVRIFNKEEYGLWSYSLNVISIIALFQGLGIHNGLLQFASKIESKARIKKLLIYCQKRSIVINLGIIFIMIIFLFFFEFPLENSNKVIILLLFSLLFQGLTQVYYSYYRSLFDNKKYSTLLLIYSISRAIFFVLLGLFFRIKGLIIAFYLSYITTCIIAFFIDKNKTSKDESYEKSLIRKIKKFSILSCSNNLLASSVYFLDVFIIGLIVADSSEVAVYKNATLIPLNLMIIPNTLMIYLFPKIRKIESDKVEIKKCLKKSILHMFVFNLIITIPLMFFSPFIIRILFTDKYMDAVTPFRILMIGYFFAGTLRIISGNMIVAINKMRANIIITIICGVFNILFDYIFISRYGIIGAAWATTSMFLLSGLISFGYMHYYVKEVK